jgi:hypothetical protein
VLSIALFLVSDTQSPLSPIESRLVGEWSADPHEYTRSFLPDRTFSTSGGQFSGVWRIDEGRLTVRYWPPPELPHGYDFSTTLQWLRRPGKTYTCTWDIEFADGNQQHSLSQPIDDLHPDGKWILTRVPGT